MNAGGRLRNAPGWPKRYRDPIRGDHAEHGEELDDNDDALRGRRGISGLVAAIEGAAKEAPGVMARPEVTRTLQLVFELAAKAARHTVIEGPPLTAKEQASLNTILAPAISSKEFAALRSASGLTIRAGAEIVAALGVFGSPGGDKDEACAQAGVASIQGDIANSLVRER